ncbi:MAG: DUF1697 domain-containing protein [Mycobacterium sp.]|nr:DUF1697 domain-containing protein [Mycobacterium sp.]
MRCYAAFLRGVNVGGVNLKMADVAAALAAAGFDDVRTVLASGNVVFNAPGDAVTVRTAAEIALRREFDYEAWVLVYDIDTVREIAAAYPFPAGGNDRHSYVTFVSDPHVLGELAALAGPDDQIVRGQGVLYWQVPRYGTLGSTVGKTMGKRRYKSTTTTRNLRTVNKVIQIGTAQMSTAQIGTARVDSE